MYRGVLRTSPRITFGAESAKTEIEVKLQRSTVRNGPRAAVQGGKLHRILGIQDRPRPGQCEGQIIGSIVWRTEIVHDLDGIIRWLSDPRIGVCIETVGRAEIPDELDTFLGGKVRLNIGSRDAFPKSLQRNIGIRTEFYGSSSRQPQVKIEIGEMLEITRLKFAALECVIRPGEFNLKVQHTSKVEDIQSFPLFLRRPVAGKLMGITSFPPRT